MQRSIKAAHTAGSPKVGSPRRGGWEPAKTARERAGSSACTVPFLGPFPQFQRRADAGPPRGEWRGAQAAACGAGPRGEEPPAERSPLRRGAPREGQVRPPAEPRLRLLSRALVCDWYCHHLTQEQVEAPGGREGRGACVRQAFWK